MCREGDKDTMQVELDLETGSTGITYAPGDALGVLPLNPQEVRRHRER